MTSAQAETILAVACQRESDNARRMRLGLEPVAQPYPYSTAATTSASSVFPQSTGTLLSNQNGNGVAMLNMSSTSSDEDAGVGDRSFDKSATNAVESDAERHNGGNGEVDKHNGRNRQEGSVPAAGGTDDTANNSTMEESNSSNVNCGTGVTSSSPNNIGKI